ncbi:hypothetical protein NFJ02_11g06490 [Pycnococcus provasolii]
MPPHSSKLASASASASAASKVERQLSNRSGKKGIADVSLRRASLFQTLCKTLGPAVAHAAVSLKLAKEVEKMEQENEGEQQMWPTAPGTRSTEKKRKSKADSKAKAVDEGAQTTLFETLEMAAIVRFSPPPPPTPTEDAAAAAPAPETNDTTSTSEGATENQENSGDGPPQLPLLTVRRGTFAQAAAGLVDAIDLPSPGDDATTSDETSAEANADASVLVESFQMPPDVATLIGAPLPLTLDEPLDPLSEYYEDVMKEEALGIILKLPPRLSTESVEPTPRSIVSEVSATSVRSSASADAKSLPPPRRSPTPSFTELQGDPAVSGGMKRWWKFIGDDRNGFISKRRHVDITRALCWLMGTRGALKVPKEDPAAAEQKKSPRSKSPRRSPPKVASTAQPEEPPKPCFDPAVVARVCQEEWERLFGAGTEAIKFDKFFSYMFELVACCRPGLHSEDFSDWLEEMLQRLENLDLVLLELPYSSLEQRQRLERRWEFSGESDPLEEATRLRKERNDALAEQAAREAEERRRAEEARRLAEELERREREEREERERRQREKEEAEERARKEREEAIRRKEEELRKKKEEERRAALVEERRRKAEEERLAREAAERERRREELMRLLEEEANRHKPAKLDMHEGRRILKRLFKRIPRDEELIGLDLRGLPGLFALTYEERTALRRYRANEREARKRGRSPWVPPNSLLASLGFDIRHICTDNSTQTFVLLQPTERDESRRKLDGHCERHTNFHGAHDASCQANMPNDHEISVGWARARLPPLALISGTIVDHHVKLPAIGQGRLRALQQCIADGTLPPSFAPSRAGGGVAQLANAVGHEFSNMLRTTSHAQTVERGLFELRKTLGGASGVGGAVVPHPIVKSCESKQNERAREAIIRVYGPDVATTMAKVAWGGDTMPSEGFTQRLHGQDFDRRIVSKNPGLKAALLGTEDSQILYGSIYKNKLRGTASARRRAPHRVPGITTTLGGGTL